MVTSSVTHRSYIIRDQLDCSDRNIIYLITCDKCHLQYVGYTKETLRYQIAQHVRSIHLAKTQGPSTPLHYHFIDSHHKMRIQPLETTTTATYNQHLTLWLDRMKSHHPRGFNINKDILIK